MDLWLDYFVRRAFQRTLIEATRLSATSAELGSGLDPGLGFEFTLCLARSFTRSPSSRPLISHTIPFPRIH